MSSIGRDATRQLDVEQFPRQLRHRTASAEKLADTHAAQQCANCHMLGQDQRCTRPQRRRQGIPIGRSMSQRVARASRRLLARRRQSKEIYRASLELVPPRSVACEGACVSLMSRIRKLPEGSASNRGFFNRRTIFMAARPASALSAWARMSVPSENRVSDVACDDFVIQVVLIEVFVPKAPTFSIRSSVRPGAASGRQKALAGESIATGLPLRVISPAASSRMRRGKP